jgi:hypothetical protein
MEIRKDFKELLESLNAHEVEYVIVGAFALAWHGHPRYTGDLDLYINPEPANAARILAALVDFGFGSLGLVREDFSCPGQVVQLGVAPVRVDLLTSISGVDWHSAWEGSESGTYDDTPVRYLGKAQFRSNKIALGRRKDLSDLEAIGESG